MVYRAITLDERVQTACPRLNGPDHPDTLASRNDLAYAYESAGDLGRAIPLYEAVLVDRERVLGGDQDLQAVVDLAARLRRIREVLYGRADLDTTATLMVCFSAAGFTDELHEIARDGDDVLLVDAARLYRT
jgi:hypothetical protein